MNVEVYQSTKKRNWYIFFEKGKPPVGGFEKLFKEYGDFVKIKEMILLPSERIALDTTEAIKMIEQNGYYLSGVEMESTIHQGWPRP